MLVILPACALIPTKIEVLPWPGKVTSMEGEGDLDIAWKKERYSGAFAVKMDYPDQLVFEVYGPFGQTLVYVKKAPGEFLVIAGDEKSTDEGLLKERFGLDANDLIDDLAMRGERKETPDGTVIERANYRVEYTQDRRGRRLIRWKGVDGTISLTFGDIQFVG
jgi:hypothetical protein